MSKHKSEDYKISAVNYYLDNDVSMDYVCNIFNCKKQSLSRWVKRYNINKSIKQNNRKYMSYKITKQQVNYAIKLLKQLKRKILEKSKIINNFQIIIY
jgi:transposase-like protein